MIRFTALPTDIVRHLQSGGADAYGNPPERVVSDGGNPCRHCLRMIDEGREMLIVAHRPFPALQPYAETGPIFLCADPCQQGGGAAIPETMAAETYIIRGYGADDRIVYGTGKVTPTPEIPEKAAALLDRPGIAYVHVRSASNNCYHTRIDRA